MFSKPLVEGARSGARVAAGCAGAGKKSFILGEALAYSPPMQLPVAEAGRVSHASRQPMNVLDIQIGHDSSAALISVVADTGVETCACCAGNFAVEKQA